MSIHHFVMTVTIGVHSGLHGYLKKFGTQINTVMSKQNSIENSQTRQTLATHKHGTTERNTTSNIEEAKNESTSKEIKTTNRTSRIGWPIN